MIISEATEGQAVTIHYDRTASTEKTAQGTIERVTARLIILSNGDKYWRSTGKKVGDPKFRPSMITLLEGE
jgi:hypothetical protein